MIDSSAQIVMQMQQPASQVNRNSGNQASADTEKSFSSHLDQSKKSQQQDRQSSTPDSPTEPQDKKSTAEQTSQTSPSSVETKKTETSDTQKDKASSDSEPVSEEVAENNQSITSHVEEEKKKLTNEEDLAKSLMSDVSNETSDDQAEQAALTLSQLLAQLVNKKSPTDEQLGTGEEQDQPSAAAKEKIDRSLLFREVQSQQSIFQRLTDVQKNDSETSLQRQTQQAIDPMLNQSSQQLSEDEHDALQIRVQQLSALVRQILADKDIQPGQEISSHKFRENVRELLASNSQLLSGNTKLEEVLQSLELDGDDLASAIHSDEMFAKLVERLDGLKNRSEVLLQLKSLTEKNANVQDIVDQLNTKNPINALDKTPMIGATLLTDRSASPLQSLPQQLVLQTQVNNPEWGADFSKRIQFLIRSNMQHAELRLDPPELGKIHVKINFSQDQANVSFASTHGNVRDAIEQALPRLRELLNESGIQLGNTDVASQFQQKNEQSAQHNQSSTVTPGYVYDEETEAQLTHQPLTEYAVNGMIDYFA